MSRWHFAKLQSQMVNFLANTPWSHLGADLRTLNILIISWEMSKIGSTKISLTQHFDLISRSRSQTSFWHFIILLPRRGLPQHQQGHHHNGDRATWRSHILCSICFYSFGASAKLYDCSLHHFTTTQCILKCVQLTFSATYNWLAEIWKWDFLTPSLEG